MAAADTPDGPTRGSVRLTDRWKLSVSVGFLLMGSCAIATSLAGGSAQAPAVAPTLPTAVTSTPIQRLAAFSKLTTTTQPAPVTKAAAAPAPAVSGQRTPRFPPPTSTTTTTTPPPPPVTGPSCGGTSVINVDGTTFHCTFDDEFNGTTLDSSKWIAQKTADSGYHSGAECFVDSPNNVSVAGGTLNLTVQAESAPFTCSDPYGDFTTQYTSGMVSTYGRFNQAYGLFQVRAKLPAAEVAGLQTSFWLTPVNAAKYGSWPASGEIDFAEFYSKYPDRAVPYIHYNAAGADPNVTRNGCMISDLTQFHTYSVEWTSQAITIMYDGATCLVDHWNPASPLSEPQPFDQPFLLALTQALGIGPNAFDPATTPLPATTEIDWVRIWS